MLFGFELSPVEGIAPWGTQAEPVLHWFGLTEGWYWLRVGDDELFRYTDAVLTIRSQESGGPLTHPYVDYPVARLWEDVQEILPHVMEPVPEDVFRKVEPGRQGDLWRARTADKVFVDDEVVSDWTEELFHHATEWLGRRRLHTAHLRYSPRIWLWTDGTMLHITWDNEHLRVGDAPVWSAREGRLSIPLRSFLRQVRSFDRRLIRAMHDRVEAIVAQGGHPTARIDLDGLLREQLDRASWMERALERTWERLPTRWDQVYDAMERLAQMGLAPW